MCSRAISELRGPVILQAMRLGALSSSNCPEFLLCVSQAASITQMVPVAEMDKAPRRPTTASNASPASTHSPDLRSTRLQSVATVVLGGTTRILRKSSKRPLQLALHAQRAGGLAHTVHRPHQPALPAMLDGTGQVPVARLLHLCSNCGVGKYSASGTGQISESVCANCVAGKYLESTGNDAASDCTVCPAGRFSTVQGSSAASDCQACAAGKYLATTGNDAASDCINCDAGKYSSSTGISHASSCFACQTGRYRSGTGATSCANCERGQYQDGTGTTSCKQCELGTIATSAGAASCVDCALGRIAPNEGTVDVSGLCNWKLCRHWSFVLHSVRPGSV